MSKPVFGCLDGVLVVEVFGDEMAKRRFARPTQLVRGSVERVNGLTGYSDARLPDLVNRAHTPDATRSSKVSPG